VEKKYMSFKKESSYKSKERRQSLTPQMSLNKNIKKLFKSNNDTKSKLS